LAPQKHWAWLRSLPKNTQTNQPVALLAAECHTMLGDWRGLQASLEQQNWAELEFVRHAFQTRALRGQDLGGAAKAEWEQALKAANGQKASLISYSGWRAQWNWQSEGKTSSGSSSISIPVRDGPLGRSTRRCLPSGRTRPLMMLYSQELSGRRRTSR